MIRVAFIISTADSGWLGGVNYIANLCQAVMALPDRKIEPVLFVDPKTPQSLLAGFTNVTIVHTPFVGRRHPIRLAGKIVERLTGRNFVLEAYLRTHGICILSHSPPLGRYSGLPAIIWIPDFQHLHLPEFFSTEEIHQRNIEYHNIVRQSKIVILSSRDAQNDFATFEPSCLARSRVLNFVSALGSPEKEPSETQLMTKYQIDRPYFYLPNQFWMHKNHKVVIEALAALRARGEPMLVIATGLLQDYRVPGHASEVIGLAANLGVADDFRPLGVVPYADVLALYRHCLAIINPSLFEGWSSSVEEGKSMGKIVLLSDIPVHREQAPERGIYFPPHDVKTLADSMHEAAAIASPECDAGFRANAERVRPARIATFARLYQEVVLEVTAS